MGKGGGREGRKSERTISAVLLNEERRFKEGCEGRIRGHKEEMERIDRSKKIYKIAIKYLLI